MKYSLIIDTSFKNINLGLVKEREVIDTFSHEYFHKHSEYLGKCIEDLFRKNNILPTRIDKVFVTVGPGSYTGIRIALAYVKTLCYLLKIPCYTVSTLRAIAGVRNNSLVILPAKKNFFYVGLYNSNLEFLKEDSLISKEELDMIISNNKNINIIDFSEVFSKPISINIINNINGLIPVLLPLNNINDLQGKYL